MSAWDDAVQKVERSFGKGAIMRLGDPAARVAVDPVPSGSIALDVALGVGGYARGRIVEIYGPESSGKTTLTLHALAQAQAMGLRCAFVDTEHALDPVYAEAVGVDPDALYVSQPDYGEQALQIVDDLTRSGEAGVIVVDSVAALTPKAELEGEMGDVTVGLQARMMSQAMRKLAGPAERTKTLLIFTNQIREKVGVMFGSPETTPGGRALRFYASQRLDVRRVGTEGAKGEETHNRVRVTVKKNKVAPPFRRAEFDVDFGRGISIEGELLDVGTELGVLAKSGGRYTFQGELIANGRAACKARLLAEPELRDALTEAVREAHPSLT